jgi:hypothetical protein
MADAIMVRQESIPLKTPKGVALVGCGGVGSWIGFMLALAGVPHLYLFDSDVVSESNLNRAPYGAAMLGKPKTEALRALIATVRPNCKVDCHPNFTPQFADALLLKDEDDLTWLVASTDTLASRRAATDWIQAQETPYAYCYMEASAEGEYGSIAFSPADFATDDEAKPGYASVPVWVGPAVSAATMACSYILHNTIPIMDETFRLGWDGNDIHFAKLGETSHIPDRIGHLDDDEEEDEVEMAGGD